MNRVVMIVLLLSTVLDGVVRGDGDVWTVTAYCPCPVCCGEYGWGYRTASGYRIKKGDRFVAAPKELKFGTWVSVPGYGRVQVKDRGGAIKGMRLDVYFDSHKEALEWGKQKLMVSIER